MAQSPGWDYQPYRVHAVVALDLPGGIGETLKRELPGYLERRVQAAIGPLWAFSMEFAEGATRNHLLEKIESKSNSAPKNFKTKNIDKLVLLSLRSSSHGITLTAREFDTYVQRWSLPLDCENRQQDSLLEQVFTLLHRSVAPVALFEVDAEDPKYVVFKPRGAMLMRIQTEPWAKNGEVYLPVLRRTSRGGKLVEDGLQTVPWTYLQVDSAKSNDPVKAKIYSGTRQPFGARRQGRVEQVAIGVRSEPASTTVKMHARTPDKKPLVGYELYVQNNPEKPEDLSRIGATDTHGMLSVPFDRAGVRLFYVKNGGRLLARLPIAAGARTEVELALPDDDARLAAETRLAALREDLIDVVARRNILMARVRQKIKSKDYEGAQQLLSEINELPGRTQFNLEITTAARLIRSNDPQIQRRIDQLVEGTQAALTQYLDVRPISELTNELRAAQQQKGS